VASGRVRKHALQGVALGLLGFIVLAGNPEIMARFMRTFTSDTSTREAKRDTTSAESRKFFWIVGLDMIEQTPFGTGGDTFDSKRARRIMKSKGGLYYNNSVHQGYINEALDWGVQGLLFHLGFIGAGIWCAFRTMQFRKKIGDIATAFYGPCLLGGHVAFLVGSLFGDFLYLEWGYWLTILAVCYTKTFGHENYGVLADTKVTAEQANDADQELLRELAVGAVGKA
jgi:O-antigen ligase